MKENGSDKKHEISQKKKAASLTEESQNKKRKLQNKILEKIIHRIESDSKKLLLILIMLLIQNSINSQTWFLEKFNEQTVIPQGWTIENDTANWSYSNSFLAAGGTGEVILKTVPVFIDSTKLISPKIDIENAHRLTLYFKHTLRMRLTGKKIGVAIRSKGKNWTKVWENKATTLKRKEVEVSLGDVSDLKDFQFCFYFNTNSNKLMFWAIDDILLYEKKDTDIKVKKQILERYYRPNDKFRPKAVVYNNGLMKEPFEVECKIFDINNVELYKSLKKVDSLEVNKKYRIEFDEFEIPDEIDKAYKCVVTSILNNDQISDNNSKEQYFYTYMSNSRDIVLFEMGTATWCSLCPKADDFVESYIEGDSSIAYIAYHANDDFSYGATSNRNDYYYYYMEGFPTIVFDGIYSVLGFGPNAENLYENNYKRRKNTKTGVDIELKSNISNGGFDINVKVSKLAPFYNKNTVVHLVVTESNIPKIWKNKTKLNHVCRRMLPDEFGAKVDMIENDVIELNYFFAPDESWDSENLEVVAFIQDNDTKEVLNTTKLKLKNPLSVYNIVDKYDLQLAGSPNPFSTNVNITFSVESHANVDLGVFDMYGKRISQLVDGNLEKGDCEILWKRENDIRGKMYIVRLIVNNNIEIIKIQGYRLN